MFAELRKINPELADLLAIKSSVPVLQIDDKQVIADCNNGFLKLFNLSKKPIGAGLADFLLPGNKEGGFDTESQEFVCNARTGVHGILLAHRMRQDKGLLLWCERLFSTNNQVVEQMALLNNEYIAIQRELAKKNQYLNRVQQELKEKVVELEATLSHVKLLEGIIPICMHCKKIRDDHDSWHKLEDYITAHSEALFSHGICDTCLKQHYPEHLEET